MKSREEALEILNEYVKSESLKKHCLAVATCMEKYAEKLGEDKDKWWICGLLHDFDWEVHPTLEQHPIEGVKILRSRGVDEDICVAILGHNEYTKVAREMRMAKTLFAVDELSGLVVAIARVKGGFDDITAKSVRNAMKKRGFAAAINRDDIRKGISELGVDEDSHFELVVGALSRIKRDLGF